MSDLSLAIEDVGAGGDGIGRAEDGRIVFVRGAIPGDRVTATVYKERKSSLHAVASTIEVASDDRVEAPCPHVAAGCGGCGWQHVDPAAQQRLKRRIVEESLRRIGRAAVDADGSLVVPLTDGPPLTIEAFRTSIRVQTGPGGPAFRAAASHDRVLVDSCLVAHPGLAELLDPATLGTNAAELTLRIGGATGERLIHVREGSGSGMSLPDDLRLVIARDEGVFHDEVAGQRFQISARSFFQTRTDGAEALVAAVGRAAGPVEGATVADLYGGVGLFTGTVLRNADEITLVESARASAGDARVNVPRATVVPVEVERWRPTPCDVVLADPPRAGLGAKAVETIAATNAARVVLVSCDAASLGRDDGLLRAAGYERRESVLVDLFPHTPHVEVVSRFDRTSA